MPDSPLTGLLEKLFDTLPTQEQTAARWLVSHPLEVALLSMREQSRNAKVVPATMTRVSKRLGFESFEALKSVHAQLLREAASTYHSKAEELIARQHGQSGQSLVTEMLSTSELHLRDLSDAAFTSDVENAAEVLSSVDRVFCIGSRACFSVAFLYHYLRSLVGNDSILLDGVGGIGMDRLRTVTKDDAVFAVSVSPYVQHTLDAAAFAAERNAKLVVITDSQLSPLARAATASIVIPTGTPSFFPSMASGIATAECLAALVATKRGETAVKTLAETEKALNAFKVYADPASQRNLARKRKK
jgi:DNA-binding MurR/RpiR family transcriptional regulator